MPDSAPRGRGRRCGVTHLDLAVMRDGGLPVRGRRDGHLPNAVFVALERVTDPIPVVYSAQRAVSARARPAPRTGAY